jgi:hypothetical protein
MQIVAYILAIWSWFVIGILIAFLWRVAFFYQKTSGQRVGQSLVLIPAVLLAAGAILYLVYDVGFIGRPVADLFLFSGGLSLVVFGIHLRELMTGERQ